MTRDRDAILRNSRPLRQATIESYLADLKTAKRKLPLHKCEGGCNRLIRNAVCQRCKQKFLDIIEGRQATLDDYDGKTFRAYYDTTAQFKRYSETIDQHVRRHRRENRVIHSLESGSTIEIHHIERSEK